MRTMKLRTPKAETEVLIVQETEKALLVRGNCSEGWFPKSALEVDGMIKEWFRNRMTLVHAFLFEAPYKPMPAEYYASGYSNDAPIS